MTKQEQSFKMARRLKRLREERGLSHDKLRDELKQFEIEISRDSLMNYEIQTEPHSKIKNGKYPNLNMGIEYLNAFAQFYGVSADYLLGLSEQPILNPQAAEAAEYTGLSKDAIHFFDVLKDYPPDKRDAILRAVNALLSESRFNESYEYWEKISLYLYTHSKPYWAPIGTTHRVLSEEQVLSILLTENNRYLEKLREVLEDNGQH